MTTPTSWNIATRRFQKPEKLASFRRPFHHSSKCHTATEEAKTEVEETSTPNNVPPL
ncbi:hypothetical protein F2Q70_00025869 [Brassica cretica]|uniref:Uncharacterized protein n=2 Tax=Brassica cretica TaxID=69181 RepID=A0A3N6RK47_BRACR|nr:hypothetical protein F2Q68_00025273 [Brassica cretica]KAF2603759.1 hypothetical protein F2Q70_00025869 [Brassica cretica]KAF3575980.1 hypothetical protein DY000_02030930 [Brassica cretica]